MQRVLLAMMWCLLTTSQREQHLKIFASASLSHVSQGEEKGETSASICLGRGVFIASCLSLNISIFADAVHVPRNSLDRNLEQSSRALEN